MQQQRDPPIHIIHSPLTSSESSQAYNTEQSLLLVVGLIIHSKYEAVCHMSILNSHDPISILLQIIINSQIFKIDSFNTYFISHAHAF